MADPIQSNLTLQEAYSRAKHALEAGAPEGAIAIAQHILRYYPRYLDAYRLLGEAYLERGQIDEAHRLFSHVLQGDPQNVLAHIGRGIVADERGDGDLAIDEYERAFEIDPSIPELRSELLRLYTGRYGSVGATIRTTPSGLAYVHLRAGLRDAAISELSYVAQGRPDRWDLEVALTEALWRNEQFDEAAAIAGDILAGHPSCVKCHWILGYLHWSSGRTASGRQYLLDAVALDPTYSIAERLWEATPWPLDPSLTRRPPALIPAWAGETLEATDLDLGLPLRTQDLVLDLAPAPPAVEPGRSTQRFRVTPSLPEAAPPPPRPADRNPTVDLAPLPVDLAPLPVDLDWFDDWASAAETSAPPPGTVGPEIAPAAADAGPAPLNAPIDAIPALVDTASTLDFVPDLAPAAPAADLAPAAHLDTVPTLDFAPDLAPAVPAAGLAPEAHLDTVPTLDFAPDLAPAADVDSDSFLLWLTRESAALPAPAEDAPAPAAEPNAASPAGAVEGDLVSAALSGADDESSWLIRPDPPELPVLPATPAAQTGPAVEPPTDSADAPRGPVEDLDDLDEDGFLAWLVSTSGAEEDGSYRQFSQSRL